MRISRFFKIIALLSQVSYFNLTNNKQRFSMTLYDGFIGLGGIYIKFLQIMMLRSDIFERWDAIEHLRVYEDVATEPLDIEQLLNKELKGKRREVILTNVEPFTAGSFGQVYRARLADGTDVIVKALRPSLVKHLKFDLALIGLAVRMINWLKPGAMLDMKMLFAEFKATTLGETNYRREAAHGLKLWERYKGHPKIVIPLTYAELTTRHILVQEYVGGLSAAQLLDMSRQGQDPTQFVKETLGSDLSAQLETLGFDALYSAFSEHMTQGDPHPGNIKFLAGNKAAIIDFGIVAHAPRDRSVLLDLMKEYHKFYTGRFDPYTFSVTTLRFYSADLVAAINTLDSFPDRSDQAKQILEELGLAAERSFRSGNSGVTAEQLLARGRLMTTFGEVVNHGNRFGLRVHHDSPNFIRAAQLFVVLTEGLGCKQAVLPVVFERVIKAVEADDRVLQGVQEAPDINRAMETLAAWLDRISAKDPVLFRKLHQHMKEPAHA